jgi:polyhydroxybutyrate depolymerase
MVKRRSLALLIMVCLVSQVLMSCSAPAAKPADAVKQPEAVAGQPSTATPAQPVALKQDSQETIKFGGLERNYLVHLPPGFNKSTSLPVVIQLHGGGGKASQQDKLTKFQALGDKENFIVVAPDGIESQWNDGKEGAVYRAATENIDDVGFISAMIDKLKSDLNIDTKRVYVTGISNGGMMTLRIGAQLSGKVAAIAAVAGSMSNTLMASSSPQRPVPVMMINGTDDPLVHIEGGNITAFGRVTGQVAAPAVAVKYWVEKNGCPSTPVKEELPDSNTSDGSKVTRETYAGCKDGAEVVYYIIQGGGHTWPGGPQYLPANIIGNTNRDFDATTTIWEFFKKHPMP